MGLREAIRSGDTVVLDKEVGRSSIRQELMAQNAEGGAGLLMLAAKMGKVTMFKHLARAMQDKVSTGIAACEKLSYAS